MTDYVPRFEEITNKMLDIFKKKNHDYGAAFADLGVVGVMTRMHDKFKRFLSVSKKQISLVNDESLNDTLLDLANYSVMALMLRVECRQCEEKPSPNKHLKLKSGTIPKIKPLPKKHCAICGGLGVVKNVLGWERCQCNNNELDRVLRGDSPT